MSDLLSIGRSGVLAYRSALTAVGENVTNAQVEGYSRRRVALTEAAGGVSQIGERAGFTFNGVMAGDVTRLWDEFHAHDISTSLSDAGRGDSRLRWLKSVEVATGSIGQNVGTSIGAVFNAADGLASDPASDVRRASFLSAIDGVGQTFRTTARALNDVATGIGVEIEASVNALNGDLKALVGMNDQIIRTQPGTSARAQALDDRDRLINSISSRIGVDTKFDAFGRVTLSVKNSSTDLLADPTQSIQLGTTTSATGAVTLISIEQSGNTPVPVTTGALSGLIDVSATLSERRSRLDDLATGFATMLNDWQAAGQTDAGVAGNPIVAGTGAMTVGLAAGVTAADIAAASPPVPPALIGVANGNLLALQAIRTSSGLEKTWTASVSSLAQSVTVAKAELSAANSRKDAAEAALDGISGVDLDREATDLLRFQQAYSASSKIIQAARETFQSILQLF